VSDPILALVAALFGGAGLKIMESILNRAKDRNDLATQIREELRRDVVSLRSEIDGLESEVVSWRERYYDLLSAFNELAIQAIGAGIAEAVASARKKISD
jgi:FtsZ-binding cell division protein ZapB